MKHKRGKVAVTRIGNSWVARPRLPVVINGELTTVQRAIHIAPTVGKAKRPPQEVIDLAIEEVHRLKGTPKSSAHNQAVGDFFTLTFLPHVKRDLRPSTHNGYKGGCATLRYESPICFAMDSRGENASRPAAAGRGCPR
jgi:hypothetical protein